MQEDKDWFDKALEYQEDGNYSQAIVAISKYVEQNPSNKRGKLLKAVIYGDLSNYELVLQILDEIKPTEDDSKRYSKLYFREMADTFSEMGNYKKR